MKFSRSKQVALRAAQQPVEPAEEYEQAIATLKAQYLADGRLYLDSDGRLSSVTSEAYDAYAEEEDRITEAYVRADIICQVNAIADDKLQVCLANHDGQGSLARLQYLAGRRDSVRAHCSPSYQKRCHAAEGVLLQITMCGFCDQLAADIQANPLGALQAIFGAALSRPPFEV